MSELLTCPFCGDHLVIRDTIPIKSVRHPSDRACLLAGSTWWLVPQFMEKWALRVTPAIKPLAWREIDPGRRFVGTGVGFTAEVALMHSGLWAFTSQHGRADQVSKETAMLRAQDVYDALIRTALS